MTTQELIEWAEKAQTAHEESWLPDQGCYQLSIHQAVQATKPPTACRIEADMVMCLNSTCWNEVQDWAAAFQAAFPKAQDTQHNEDVKTLIETLWEIQSAWGLEPGICELLLKLQKEIGYTTEWDAQRQALVERRVEGASN